MNRIFKIAVLILSVSTILVHAQTGIYATFDASRYVNNNVFLTPPTNSSNSENGWLYGPTVGLYSDFIHAGPIEEKASDDPRSTSASARSRATRAESLKSSFAGSTTEK